MGQMGRPPLSGCRFPAFADAQEASKSGAKHRSIRDAPGHRQPMPQRQHRQEPIGEDRAGPIGHCPVRSVSADREQTHAAAATSVRNPSARTAPVPSVTVQCAPSLRIENRRAGSRLRRRGGRCSHGREITAHAATTPGSPVCPSLSRHPPEAALSGQAQPEKSLGFGDWSAHLACDLAQAINVGLNEKGRRHLCDLSSCELQRQAGTASGY